MIFRPMAASILLTGCGTMGLDLLQQDSGAMDGILWLVLEPQAGLVLALWMCRAILAIQTAMLTGQGQWSGGVDRYSFQCDDLQQLFVCE